MNTTNKNALEALKQFEAAFDNWYSNSGYMCECMDSLKQAENQAMLKEVAALRGLVAASIRARNVIARATGGAL